MTDCYRAVHLLLLAIAVVVTGCDQSSLKNEPNYGDSYIISQANSAVGDANSGSFDGSVTNDDPTVTVPDTVDYFVQAYNSEKSYSWSLNDSEVPTEARSESTYEWERRGGEFITVYYTASDPLATVSASGGTNTLSVNSPDDEIDAETLEIATNVPSLPGQIGRLGSFSTLAVAATSSGIAAVLSGDGPFTVLGPRTAAFDALSALPSQATDDGEDATSSVRGQILQYHAIAGDVASGDLSDGQTAPTLLGDLEVTFGVSGGTVTVNESATVVRPDVPVTNGALHRLDGVLLPPTGLVDFTDRELSSADTQAGDTVVVDGASIPEDGGFIVLHNQDELQNQGPITSIVGVSGYLAPGIHNEVKVALGEDIGSTATVGAMPHRDSDNDETYDFETSGGSEDRPYTLDGSAVIDFGTLTISSP
jgi:uncharacterized surface protein with fasciclin (FAS1) repeats